MTIHGWFSAEKLTMLNPHNVTLKPATVVVLLILVAAVVAAMMNRPW
jgi:hypothetical protein